MGPRLALGDLAKDCYDAVYRRHEAWPHLHYEQHRRRTAAQAHPLLPSSTDSAEAAASVFRYSHVGNHARHMCFFCHTPTALCDGGVLLSLPQLPAYLVATCPRCATCLGWIG